MSLVIKGRVFADGTVAQRAVRIENGLISDVANSDPGGSTQTIALRDDQILVPAAVDTLAAMRDWAVWCCWATRAATISVPRALKNWHATRSRPRYSSRTAACARPWCGACCLIPRQSFIIPSLFFHLAFS